MNKYGKERMRVRQKRRVGEKFFSSRRQDEVAVDSFDNI